MGFPELRPLSLFRMAPRWAIAALFVLGCSHGSARLAGHWRGVRAEGTSNTVEDAASAFAGKLQLDVTGDVVTITTPSGKQSSHYKVVSEDATTTVLVTDTDGPGDPQTFTFVDPKTVRWAIVAGKSIVLTKE
jgi:hypothetical protein